MKWDTIDGIYTAPEFQLNKGTNFRLEVQVSRDIDEFEKKHLASFVHSFSPIVGTTKSRPFKVTNETFTGNTFCLVIHVSGKSLDIKVHKDLCIAMLDYFNLCEVNVNFFETELLDNRNWLICSQPQCE